MDGIEPELVDRARGALERSPGVLSVSGVKLRWIGHRLQGAATIVVADTVLSVAEATAHRAELELAQALPNLDDLAIRTVTAPSSDGE
jgi:divalent metal cation (Fe/Co/Zn/Cd) transporter